MYVITQVSHFHVNMFCSQPFLDSRKQTQPQIIKDSIYDYIWLLPLKSFLGFLNNSRCVFLRFLRSLVPFPMPRRPYPWPLWIAPSGLPQAWQAWGALWRGHRRCRRLHGHLRSLHLAGSGVLWRHVPGPHRPHPGRPPVRSGRCVVDPSVEMHVKCDDHGLNMLIVLMCFESLRMKVCLVCGVCCTCEDVYACIIVRISFIYNIFTHINVNKWVN